MAADGEEPIRRSEAFFGRRHGKTLRPRSAEALETVLPRFRLDLGHAAPADLATLFDPGIIGKVEAVRLEIGFGGGEHLLHEARRFPGIGFIGAEAFVNGTAKVAMRLAEAPLPNLRLWDEDAALLLDWLPDASLAGIDLLYPDPWPRRRHWKRRFVGPANLARFARVLKSGATFRFASDIANYVNWTLLHLRARPEFEWTAKGPGDWREAFEGWPGTRYEAKALREGRTPAYLAFRRT